MTATRFFHSLTHKDTPKYLASDFKLYERQPVTQLWHRLTQVTEKQWSWLAVPEEDRWIAPDTRVVIVSGPPGNGKSSACYEWAVRVCRLEFVECVTWLDCASVDREQGAWVLRRCTESANKYSVTKIPVPQNSDNFVGSVAVFDGLRAETIGSWTGVFAALCRKGIAVILCSSESVRIHVGNTQDIAQLRHRFPSWSLEEYKSACEDDEFWNKARRRLPGSPGKSASPVEKEYALALKFEFAGHCARFMFRTSITNIQDYVAEGVVALENSIESMQAALKKDGNAGAVNRLIAFLDCNGPTPVQTAGFPTQVAAAPNRDALQLRDDEVTLRTARNVFVSVYAAREVLEDMPVDVDKLRSAAALTGNRAIEGYALEIRVQQKLMQARETNASLSFTVSGELEIWNVAKFQKEAPQSVEDAIANNTAVDAWFWIGGNQGGYDAIHVYSENCIRFVQVTAGGSHSFYLDYVDSLLRNVALKGRAFNTVDFVTLRPSDDDREFNLEAPRGRLNQGWNSFAGLSWARGDARNHARVLKVDW